MRAMTLRAPRVPLAAVECDDPTPGPGDVRLKVPACGVCRTDLHIVDGDLPMICDPRFEGRCPSRRDKQWVSAADAALEDLRAGRFAGAAVLVP